MKTNIIYDRLDKNSPFYEPGDTRTLPNGTKQMFDGNEWYDIDDFPGFRD